MKEKGNQGVNGGQCLPGIIIICADYEIRNIIYIFQFRCQHIILYPIGHSLNNSPVVGNRNYLFCLLHSTLIIPPPTCILIKASTQKSSD